MMESTYAGNGIQDRLPPSAESRPRGQMHQALWQQMVTADTPESYCRSWLALQCGMIAGVSTGVVLSKMSADAAFAPMAFWPDVPQDRRLLAEVAERMLLEGRSVVLRRELPGLDDGPPQVRYHLAYPLQVARRVHSIIVLDIAPRPAPQSQAVMRQLQWGSAWLALFLQRQQQTLQTAPQGHAPAVLELLATLLEHPRVHAAATAFVTALATRLACDRVSLGFVHRGQVRVRAISHSAHFGKRTNLTRALEAAMDETFNQGTAVTYPPAPETPFRITRAHEALVRQHGTGTVCSIPLPRDESILGVLTLERPTDHPFAPADIELCEAIAALAGPILDAQRREDRWLSAKVAEALHTQLGRLFGPRYVARKLVVLALLALATFFAMFQADYRVAATTVLEPEVRRAVLAPFEGYIADAPRRAGELVGVGEVLCTLDDRDLRLERLKWRSQREQYAKQYQQALAQRNAALAQIITAQIAQAEAELALVEEHLERSQLRAPFDSLVVSGDLSQSIGAPVERGKVLFEVAPLEAYRVILEVDERDIAEVADGQEGHLVLSAFPNAPLPFTVTTVTPVSTARAGRNYFRVEARLTHTSARLRPGMEGIGKIAIDRRLLLWIWTHQAVDWLRLQLWSWLP
jgi:multidrug resistance efflux pump